jgi:hypothetical protein
METEDCITTVKKTGEKGYLNHKENEYEGSESHQTQDKGKQWFSINKIMNLEV